MNELILNKPLILAKIGEPKVNCRNIYRQSPFVNPMPSQSDLLLCVYECKIIFKIE